MRFLLILALVAGGVWAVVHYVPSETRHDGLARLGVARFFEETLPAYLRKKFSVREEPAKKRAGLLNELARELDAAAKDIEALRPKEGAAGATNPLPSSAEVRERAERISSALARSEELLDAVGRENSAQGTLEGATARVLDAVLPLSQATATPASCPN